MIRTVIHVAIDIVWGTSALVAVWVLVWGTIHTIAAIREMLDPDAPHG